MIKIKHTSEKYPYGQRMFLKRPLSGKPKVAFIVCDTDNEHLIKMSEHLPYKAGVHPHFFVHIEDLITKWRHEKDGQQIKLF